MSALAILAPGPVHALEFGTAPNGSLALDSHQAGERPAHRLSFDVRSGELETYRALIAYPPGFEFDRFDALGPPNTPVGALQLDLDFDGVADITVPLRSLGPTTAYADVIPDGQFTPAVEPVLGHSGVADFHLILPLGGDANPQTLVAPRAGRVGIVLFAGLLRNPTGAGTYTIRAELTSVDPDTDGPDDGQNAQPLTAAFAVDVTIPPPVDALPGLYLRGAGPAANPPVLFLDSGAPAALVAKHRDSAAVRYAGGNPWQEIGAWQAVPDVAEGTLSGATFLLVWLGLRNSDDQGTQFDLRADIEKNATTVASGTTRCITGLTRNPAAARPVSVAAVPGAPVEFDGGADVLRLRIWARIGTNPDGGRCAGPGGSHVSATGLRLYFDAVDRPSALGAAPP